MLSKPCSSWSKLFVAAPLLLSGTFAAAQSAQGSLRGLVTDATGATIPKATVTLIDEQKKTTRIVQSDSAGQYVFTGVDPSTYTVRVEFTGFKLFARSNVVISSDATATADAVLSPGSADQVIEVVAGTVELDTSDPDTSATFGEVQMNELPINSGGSSRSPFTLSMLSANVVPAGAQGFGFTDQSNLSYVSVAGSPEATNQYLVDGIPITDTINRPIFVPAVEAVQEVKTQVTTYDAEMSRTGGGVFNTVIKSGTNVLHGSLYGLTSQANWNANIWANNGFNGTKLPRANTPFYNYAGSLGGPVRIPHLYNGKDKTFFFIAEEGARGPGSASGTYVLPTNLERVGDFTQSSTIIYDPFTAVGGVRKSFLAETGSNKIPAQYLNKVGLNIASYLPSVTPGSNTYVSPLIIGGGARGDEFVSKLDHQFFPWWHANASYNHFGSTISFANPLNNVPGSPFAPNYERHVDATAVTSVFTINPTTIVTARFGFNRFPNVILPPSQGFSPTTLGLPNYNYQTNFFPKIALTNFSTMGIASANIDNWYSRNFNAGIQKNLGRHSLRGGVEQRSIYMAFTDLADAPGDYTFNGQFTQSKAGATDKTGNAIADLVMGLPSAGDIERTQQFYNHVRYFAGYVQDDFRLSKTLTFNLGLRYEYETGLKEAGNNEVTGFDTQAVSPLAATTGLPIKGGLRYAGVDGSTQCCALTHKKFAPRIGVAYAVTPKTVLRGGYALLYAPMRYDPTAALNTGYSISTPLVSTTDNGATVASGFTFNNPFPSGVVNPTGNANRLLSGVGTPIAAYDQQFKAPLVSQFSFDVQRELPGQILFDVAYVATRGRHLPVAPTGAGTASSGGGKTNFDQLNPSYFSRTDLSNKVANPFYQPGGPGFFANPTVAQSQLLLPFPQFSSVNLVGSYSASQYDSLSLKAEKHSRGLTFVSTYTWSRNMDGEYGLNGTGPQNVYDLKSEWSHSYINLPMRATGSVNYDLPFGRGQRILGGINHFVDAFVGGWHLGVVQVIQTGYDLAITQTNVNSNIGTSVQRPNIVPGASILTKGGNVFSRTRNYLNKAAFTDAPIYTFGNAPRVTTARAPGRFDTDANMQKTFNLSERFKFTFIAQATNVWNKPDYSGPANANGNNQLSIDSPTFGQMSGASNNRVIKLGGRMTF